LQKDNAELGRNIHDHGKKLSKIKKQFKSWSTLPFRTAVCGSLALYWICLCYFIILWSAYLAQLLAKFTS
jgi:hypothetical protein